MRRSVEAPLAAGAAPDPRDPRPIDARTLDPRLARVRRLAWLLDRSIPLGGRVRIGLDPLIGLLPGGGDILGVLFSTYIIAEGARLGLPANVIVRMLGNVAMEALVGTIPLVGDVFDAAWQANMRNVRLVEQHYRPERPGRPLGRIVLVFSLIGLSLVALVATLAAVILTALWRWLS